MFACRRQPPLRDGSLGRADLELLRILTKRSCLSARSTMWNGPGSVTQSFDLYCTTNLRPVAGSSSMDLHLEVDAVVASHAPDDPFRRYRLS